MKILIDKVDNLIEQETARITAEFGKYHSDHEAYAVLREEVDEVKVEMARADSELKRLWELIKQSKEEVDKGIEPSDTAFLFLACEAIQCASVCRKWRRQKVNLVGLKREYIEDVVREDDGFISGIVLKDGRKIEIADRRFGKFLDKEEEE